MNPIATVLLGTGLLGCASGVAGTFAVLRRRALVGDVFAHAALPGICLAFMLAGERGFWTMFAGALVFGLAAMGLISLIRHWTCAKEDAAMGIALSSFFGAGIALSSVVQRLPGGGGKAGLERFLYGQAAGIIRQDLWMIAAAAAVTILVVALFFKEFQAFSFDPLFARALGWPTLLLDLLLMVVLAVVTAVGLPAAGVVLMAALLIIPAASARLWTDRLGPMLVLSGALGAVAGIMGTLFSSGLLGPPHDLAALSSRSQSSSLPTGPMIVLSATALFIISMLFAPRRGLLARSWALWRLRRRTADENLLRALYELSESRGEPRLVPWDEACRARGGISRPVLQRLARRSVRRESIEATPAGLRLSSAGWQKAQEVVRRHRLWELFLIHGVNIAPDHVDRDADAIEHLLPPEVVRQLEASLAGTPATVRHEPMPDSPHQIDHGGEYSI